MNVTKWGSLDGINKVGKIIKTGLLGVNLIIIINYALENLTC